MRITTRSWKKTTSFPRFEQAGKLIELTVNLRAQHAMGRRVTERITAAAKERRHGNAPHFAGGVQRMYRPMRREKIRCYFRRFTKL